MNKVGQHIVFICFIVSLYKQQSAFFITLSLTLQAKCKKTEEFSPLYEGKSLIHSCLMAKRRWRDSAEYRSSAWDKHPGR